MPRKFSRKAKKVFSDPHAKAAVGNLTVRPDHGWGSSSTDNTIPPRPARETKPKASVSAPSAWDTENYATGGDRGNKDFLIAGLSPRLLCDSGVLRSFSCYWVWQH